MQLPETIKTIIYRLESAGYSVWCVGGCVRDFLMGNTPNDFDMCTSARPEQIIEVFGKENTLTVGLEHGTVAVKNGNGIVEITTFRTDGEYSDCRHPDKVEFCSDLKSDLSRRDFTVNAMAYNPQKGYVDLFGGEGDIEKKIIRCVGEPEKRFEEDALRMLRAVRFSSQLGFDVEEKTAAAIDKMSDNIKKVSTERIFEELCKTLMGDNPSKVLNRFSGLLSKIIPEMSACIGFEHKSKYHDSNVYEHILRVVDASDKIPALRIAALLHDIAKPEVCVCSGGINHFYGHAEAGEKYADVIMSRFKSSKKLHDDVVFLVKNHNTYLEPVSSEIQKALFYYGKERLELLFKMQIADALGHAPNFVQPRLDRASKSLEILNKIIAENRIYLLSQLNIKGDNAVFDDLEDKSKIKIILTELLFDVIDEKIVNSKIELEKAANDKKCAIW